MIPPLRKWCDRKQGSWLTIRGEDAHLVWWRLLASAWQRRPADDHCRRVVQGRPVQRALLIADLLVYPAWWAVWLALHATAAVVALFVQGLPGSFWDLVAGVAGPRNPRSVSRLLAVATRIDPPALRAAWFQRDDGCFYVVETRERARLPGEVS